MAKGTPKFENQGYCRKCGQVALLSATGMCESCWKEHKAETKKNRPKPPSIKDFLAPFVEQISAGANPKDVLVSILTAGGYQVELTKKK